MNRVRIFLAVWIVVLLIVGVACVKGSTPTLADNHPFAVQGLVFPPYTDDKITIENTATGEVLTVGLIIHDDESMEYMENLANLVDEWQEGDQINVTFSDQTFKVIATHSIKGARVDFNAPEGYIPTPFDAGTFLVLTAAGYYLIKRRKETMTEETMETVEQIETDSKQEFIPYFDRFFGGTKRGWIIIVTLYICTASAAGITVPELFLQIYAAIMVSWFGIGGINALKTN